MKRITKLIKEARKLCPSKIFFYFSSMCKKCNKNISECECKNEIHNNKCIDFIKVASREEALKCLKEEEI